MFFVTRKIIVRSIAIFCVLSLAYSILSCSSSTMQLVWFVATIIWTFLAALGEGKNQ